MFRRFLSLTLALMLVTSGAFAHSGRTDAYGGHRDRRNASGLGPYHYHCGGYPAHLHPDGVCPYTGLRNNNPNYPSSFPAVKTQKPKMDPGLTDRSVPFYQAVPPPPKQVPKKSTETTKQSPKSVHKITSKVLNFNGKSASVNTIIQNGSSLMEVRSFADAMGFVVAAENGAVSVSGSGAKTLYLYPNSTKARLWNGYDGNTSKDLVSPVKTQVIGGRTYVPVRFLVESLGLGVRVDGGIYHISRMDGADEVVSYDGVGQSIEKSYPFGKAVLSEPIYFQDRFYYKDGVLDVDLIEYDGSFLVDVVAVSALCDLTLRSFDENGTVVVYVDNIALLPKDDRAVRLASFGDGEGFYLVSLRGSEGKPLRMDAEIESVKIGDRFYVSEFDFYFAMGLRADISKDGTFLTDAGH